MNVDMMGFLRVGLSALDRRSAGPGRPQDSGANLARLTAGVRSVVLRERAIGRARMSLPRSRRSMGAMSTPIVVGVDPVREDTAPVDLAAVLGELTGAPVIAVAAYPQHTLPTGLVPPGYE